MRVLEEHIGGIVLKEHVSGTDLKEDICVTVINGQASGMALKLVL